MVTTLFSFSRMSDLDTLRVYFKGRSDKKGKVELERKIFPGSYNTFRFHTVRLQMTQQ